MSSSEKPLIAVAGATSKQGRSVAHALLQSGRYRVRALTRRIDSAEATALAERGAELALAPLELGRTKEFSGAFQGAEGAFLLTPVVIPPDSVEFQIGKELADAAVAGGVRRIVFSSLENVDKITGGAKFAPHFTDKARLEDYIRTLPVTSAFVMLAYFYTNFVEYYPPHQDGDTVVFPMYLPEDYRAPFVDPLTAAGPAVLELFDNLDRYAGHSLPVIGDMITPGEMVATFSRVTGKKARYVSAFKKEEFLHYYPHFAGLGQFAEESEGMVQFTVEYGFFRPDRDVLWSRRINPNSDTWEQFLRRTGWQGQHQSFGAG